MRVIKEIGVVIAGPEGGIQWYSIGTVKNGLEIVSIENSGSEFEDHVHSEYAMLDTDGKVVLHFENCPVIVEWMEVPENNGC